jgi:hypothetical protein
VLLIGSEILHRHVAHKGGSNPKEKNHITASFRDKNRKQISNKFNGGVSLFAKHPREERHLMLVPLTEKPPPLREQQGSEPRGQDRVGKEQRTNQGTVEISPNGCRSHPNAWKEQYQGQGQAKSHKELFQGLPEGLPEEKVNV